MALMHLSELSLAADELMVQRHSLTSKRQFHMLPNDKNFDEATPLSEWLKHVPASLI